MLMRLNPDCIRDILISFNDKIDLSIPYIVKEINCKDICDKYSSKELCYHMKQCLYHDFLTGTDKGNCIEVKGISLVGNDFLAYFYDEKDWIEINKIADKVGSRSIETLKHIFILRKIKETEMKNSKGGKKMEYHFYDENLERKVVTKEERIEHLKNLSKKLREQLFEKPKTLLPDEVEYFISIFKAELEHLYKN
jgi:hypothetical protein